MATENQFYVLFDYVGPKNDSLVASLSLLGQRDNAIYASASMKWGNSQANSFDLNAIYDDRTLSFYNSGGKLGSLLFEDLNLVVDFAKLTLDGAVDFRNEKTFKSGETKVQSGKIGISASGQSFSDSILQALTGQDYGLDFKLSITDFLLADGYRIGDSQIDMHLENGLLSFSGSLINGSLDTASGYIDLVIDGSEVPASDSQPVHGCAYICIHRWSDRGRCAHNGTVFQPEPVRYGLLPVL